MAYYVLDESKNIFEGMTKEQIMAAIVQAVNQGTVSDIDAGFVTKLQEQNDGDSFKVWIGTSAEYAALTETDEHTLYMITDDTTFADIVAAIQTVASDLQEYKTGIANGTIHAHTADNATEASTAAVATLAQNSARINGLNLKRDENGILKIGDTVIQQYKYLLQNGTQEFATGGTVYSDENALTGRVLEIRFYLKGLQGFWVTDQASVYFKFETPANGRYAIYSYPVSYYHVTLQKTCNNLILVKFYADNASAGKTLKADISMIPLDGDTTTFDMSNVKFVAESLKEITE